MAANTNEVPTTSAAATECVKDVDYQNFDLEQQPTPNLMKETMKSSLVGNEKENCNSNNNLKDAFSSMTTEELYKTLKEYDVLQDKYHTVLLLPKESETEATTALRDSSAYIIRCLKIWYDMPTEVFCSAISLMDAVIDQTVVKPKQVTGASIACFCLAIKHLKLKPIPTKDLVNISQCGHSPSTLERMACLMSDSLGIHSDYTPITSISFLRIYFILFRNYAKNIGGQCFELFKQRIKVKELENRLEILLCHVSTTIISSSTLALALVCLHISFQAKESSLLGSSELKHLVDYMSFFQEFMSIPDRIVGTSFHIVASILSHYNEQKKLPHKQRLLWKLSTRTLRILHPTKHFSTVLPTINEDGTNAMDDSLRSKSEEEFWPTSAITPIFEES